MTIRSLWSQMTHNNLKLLRKCKLYGHAVLPQLWTKTTAIMHHNTICNAEVLYYVTSHVERSQQSKTNFVDMWWDNLPTSHKLVHRQHQSLERNNANFNKTKTHIFISQNKVRQTVTRASAVNISLCLVLKISCAALNQHRSIHHSTFRSWVTWNQSVPVLQQIPKQRKALYCKASFARTHLV